jgi:Protein of unknown function (DUF3631)
VGNDPLADYLDQVRGFVRRYIAFPSEHEPIGTALWVAHAHLVEQSETSPILTVTSAEMRSGKNRLLDCVELLVPSPVRMILPSEAVFYTVLALRPRPTVLLDEVDAIFGSRTAERYEGIRAVLNSGNRRGAPVLRVKLDGRRRTVERFDVFGAKVVAGAGELPSTVADRAIPIRLRRRRPDEPVERFRLRRATAEAQAIAHPEWSALMLPAEVAVPEKLPDRAADGWESLLAIADAAAGPWPQWARVAAVTLSAEAPATVSTGIQLLGDVREAFDGAVYLSTGALLEQLHAMEGAPWGDWFGRQLTARALATLLRPYRIGSRLQRVDGQPSRGYWSADFQDAWARYLPCQGTDTSDTSDTRTQSVTDVADVTVPRKGTEPEEPLPGWGTDPDPDP